MDELIEADELVSVTPFLPADITVIKQEDGVLLHGHYGLDLFPNHKFLVRIDGELKEYNTTESIPLEFDNVVDYSPDSTHDITFTYTFKKDNIQFTLDHWVHHDMSVWERYLPELLLRETNGGWK